jgi:hypothetical protein
LQPYATHDDRVSGLLPKFLSLLTSTLHCLLFD